MDKKNFILGLLCLSAAFFLFSNQERKLREQLQSSANVEKTAETPVKVEVPMEGMGTSYKLPSFNPSQMVTLENAFIKVHFSIKGGAIHSVEMKRFSADISGIRSYIFNQQATYPALTLAWDPKHPWTTDFKITAQTDHFIQFSAELPDGTVVVRGYQIEKSDARNPYTIRNEFAIRQSNFTHDSVWLYLGTMPDTPGDKYLEYLNFAVFDGKKVQFKRMADFEASNGFLGIGRHGAHSYLKKEQPARWVALKNQFFTAILTPKKSVDGYLTFPRNVEGCRFLDGLVKFELTGSDVRITSDYFVGPKDFMLLDKMGEGQDQLMQFGFFGAVSKILLMSMRGIHALIPNWGWTIILLTIIIKMLMWPITQAQLRSSKKMASIQVPLKQIREKYKANPQKLQMETMKLFKENKINPAAGCLPIFIQIPIFIGLYYMLRTSSEIRFQSFLWIKDLSVPDTIAYWGSFPINILPLLMGITMFVQMRITPTPSMDGMQQKIIKWMPFIFLVFCYSFPAALILYWTVQNLFTIFQQWLTNRMMKNVQPEPLKH